MSFAPFSGGGFHGEVNQAWTSELLLDEVVRITDPNAAVETVHWGRNYLYTALLHTARGSAEVVVKQFRNLGWIKRMERRLRGSKATRSWRVARALIAAEIKTPDPVLLIESDKDDGPSYFVAERLSDVFEVRHFFRRLNRSADAGDFPEVDDEAFLAQLGGLARRLHDAGIWYRDLSLGNVLARPCDQSPLELFVVDFNRARIGRRLGVIRRSRDICRFPVIETGHRQAFLRGYWGEVPPRWSPRWWVYVLSVRGYLFKHSFKGALRGKKRLRRVNKGGKHHAHIPAATAGARRRDRVVWDHLSDQPHQHAGRFSKLAIRLADSPSHLRDIFLVAGSAPRVWRRYRSLRQNLHSTPQRFSGVGICVRPWEADPAAHLALVEELGVRRVLLRLHPWDTDHAKEETLARELTDRGVDLAFVLPQNRELVRNRQQWRAAVRELAERFRPFGRHFQVGQAVNRSKWGVWTRDEYVRLFVDAAEILREDPQAELLGPSVIDFEHQVTQALVQRRVPGLFFDVVSSLLYVDRRGAPENTQLGFDTVAKVLLLKAIADTGRCSTGRCWITEVNWPLWEGPHSPAGRTVSVDEEAQADYLVRYYLLALGSGVVERVYWWRIIARGYGLVAPSAEGDLRRRPAFFALQTLNRLLDGSELLAVLPTRDGAHLYHFRTADDELCVGWSEGDPCEVQLPRTAVEVIDRDGRSGKPTSGTAVMVKSSPTYYRLVAVSA